MKASEFIELSEQAQELIISAIMGDFDKSCLPPIPDNVKAEIAAWASTNEN